MKRENLKIALQNHYDSLATINSILRGIRRPKYEVIIKLNHQHKIPFEVWVDIKSYIKNDTKQEQLKSNPNQNKKAS
ncbi:MAG: hypothetical protein QM497_04825 [Sulfurimonas sp.]